MEEGLDTEVIADTIEGIEGEFTDKLEQLIAVMKNKEAFAALPSDLQAIVTSAMRTANQDMLDEYTARNNTALDQLKNKHNVKLRKFSPEVMQALKAATMEVISEQARNDEAVAKVWRSYSEFLQQVKAYHQISEMEYYSNR